MSLMSAKYRACFTYFGGVFTLPVDDDIGGVVAPGLIGGVIAAAMAGGTGKATAAGAKDEP